MQELVAEAGQYDVLLIGEVHDDAEAHRLECLLLQVAVESMRLSPHLTPHMLTPHMPLSHTHARRQRVHEEHGQTRQVVLALEMFERDVQVRALLPRLQPCSRACSASRAREALASSSAWKLLACCHVLVVRGSVVSRPRLVTISCCHQLQCLCFRMLLLALVVTTKARTRAHTHAAETGCAR